MTKLFCVFVFQRLQHSQEKEPGNGVLPCSPNPGSFGAMKRVRRSDQQRRLDAGLCKESKEWPEQASVVKQLTNRWGGNSEVYFLFALLGLCAVCRCVLSVCPGTTAQQKGFIFLAVFNVVVTLFPGYRTE